MGNVDAYRLLIFNDDSEKGSESLYGYIQYMNKHWAAVSLLICAANWIKN
jgi:hypothetical protein